MSAGYACGMEEMMKKIALTFDDGPNTVVTPLVLDLLEQYNVKATFFLVGEKITPETAGVMRRAVRMGCELENHSFSHSAMTELTEEEGKAEIEKTDSLIRSFAKTKVRFFRPPYIAMNAETAKGIKYPLICGAGCRDWDENVSVETRVKEVLANAEDGQIVLLHDSDYNMKTVSALKTIIPELLRQDYELVTVSELFSGYGEAPEIGTGRLYSKIERQDDHNRFAKMALVNDLSGFGRCSITVQLPIVSAMGIQGCVLPTAILSNHTGYDSFFYDDYTDKMETYISEWKKLDLRFEGICTGFLGSEQQIDIVRNFLKDFKTAETTVIVDPVMGDDGILYATYNESMCRRLAELLPYADIVTPNLTEACALAELDYGEFSGRLRKAMGAFSGASVSPDSLLESLAERIAAKGPDKVVITGIEREPYISNFYYDKGHCGFVDGIRVGCKRAGTGDVFSALIAGFAVSGTEFVEAIQRTVLILETCMERSSARGIPPADGVCFEEIMRLLH